jgi:hypothetical protein
MVRESADIEDYLKRLDRVIVRENYNVALGFKQGYVFFRVINKELYPLLYDPFSEITNFAGAGNIDMPSGMYITAKELPSVTLSSTNIWKVDKTNHMYQLFFGIAPSITRVFIAYPRETEINQLDEGLHIPSYPIYGFIDGFESPINAPSPRSQLIVPYGPLVAFAFYNYAPYNIKPMLRFIVNRLMVEVITDPDLIQKILKRQVECTFATAGGLDNIWGNALYRQWWGVDPIDLLSTKAQIVAAVTPTPAPARGS